MPPETPQPKSRRRAAAGALCGGVFLWMCLTSSGPGVTWDETFYLGFAARYGVWTRAALGGSPTPDDYALAPRDAVEATFARPFERRALRYWWGIDPLRPGEAPLGQKHPPLGKIVSSVCMAAFVPLLDPVVAARVGSALLFALLCLCVYGLGAEWGGYRTGAFSVLALLAMPRLVGHMRLATLEPALLLTTAFAFLAFLKGQRSRTWAVLCGVGFGLALLTKINAALILPAAGAWALLFARRATRPVWLLPLWVGLCAAGGLAATKWPVAIAAPLILAPFGLYFVRRSASLPLMAMALIAPIVFFAGWPALWADPLGGALLYLQDKFAARAPIPVYYLGSFYRWPPAPWHYAVVMPLVTTPLLVLASGVAGAREGARERRQRPEGFKAFGLVALAAAFPILAAVGSAAGRCDGVRMMLSAFPFVAIVAGGGAARAWGVLREKWGDRPGAAALAPALAAVWALAPHTALNPYELSYYNELIGGPWGARAAGMETTYWFDTFTAEAAEFLNRHAEEGAKVAYAPPESNIHYWNQIAGRLRSDLEVCGLEDDWDYLVVISRRGWIENPDDPAMARVRGLLAARVPRWVAHLTRLRRVPVCRIYDAQEDAGQGGG